MLAFAPNALPFAAPSWPGIASGKPPFPRKTRVGIFFRTAETRARKLRRKSRNLRLVARPAAPKTASGRHNDAETGLLYYGRRYYQPTLGRWLGRDPIEEKGGLHLYGFCGNNGVNRWDYLGMDPPLEAASLSDQYEANRQGTIQYYINLGYTGSEATAKADASLYGPNEMQDNFWWDARQAESGSFNYGGYSNGNYEQQNLQSFIDQTNGITVSMLEAGGDFSLSRPEGMTNSEIAGLVFDVAGKVWNLPNTLIGVAAGLIGWTLGGEAPIIQNNAIVFANSPVAPIGAITLGNTIIVGTPYGPTGPGTGANDPVLLHEQQHTYQGQVLGPLYFLSNGLGLAAGIIFNNGNEHGPANWNEVGPQQNPPRPWPWE